MLKITPITGTIQWALVHGSKQTHRLSARVELDNARHHFFQTPRVGAAAAGVSSAQPSHPFGRKADRPLRDGKYQAFEYLMGLLEFPAGGR
jgi:hypothetical protein